MRNHHMNYWLQTAHRLPIIHGHHPLLGANLFEIEGVYMGTRTRMVAVWTNSTILNDRAFITRHLFQIHIAFAEAERESWGRLAWVTGHPAVSDGRILVEVEVVCTSMWRTMTEILTLTNSSPLTTLILFEGKENISIRDGPALHQSGLDWLMSLIHEAASRHPTVSSNYAWMEVINSWR
jgi:hypothetical protein